MSPRTEDLSARTLLHSFQDRSCSPRAFGARLRIRLSRPQKPPSTAMPERECRPPPQRRSLRRTRQLAHTIDRTDPPPAQPRYQPERSREVPRTEAEPIEFRCESWQPPDV